MLAATRPPPLIDRPPTSSDELNIPRADALAPAFLHLLRDVPQLRTDIDEKRESSCQKLLFSATLTRDPAKIASLNLREPKYFVVQSQQPAEKGEGEGVLDFVMEKFGMPATLTVRLFLPLVSSSCVEAEHVWGWLGTHACMLARREAAHTLPSRARTRCRQRTCVHQVRGVHGAARQALRVL